MSSRFTYHGGCGCNSGNSRWEIVSSDSSDARNHLAIKHNKCCKPDSPPPKRYYKQDSPPRRRNPCDDHHHDHHDDREKERKNCCGFAQTLVSVKNPDTIITVPGDVIGGSNIHAQAIVNVVPLTNWSDIIPHQPAIFNNATGIYTAIESGDYQIILTLNYKTSAPISVDTLLTNVPTIEAYDVATDTRLAGSLFPTIHIVIPPLASGDPGTDVAFIQGAGQVIINVVVPLTVGQRVGIRAVSNGLIFEVFNALQLLTATIDLSPPGVDTTLAIFKIRNTPQIVFICNN